MPITVSLKATPAVMSGEIPSSIIHKPKDPLCVTWYSRKYVYCIKPENINEETDNLNSQLQKS